MANSLPGSRVLRLAMACCAGLLGVASAAPAPRVEEKIVLEAVPVNIDYRKNTAVLKDVVITQGTTRIEAAEANVKGGLDFDNGEWTISGNVRIKAEGGNLRSDKAVVAFRNKLISQATITGNPAEFEQQRKDGSTARGRAATIRYEPSSGIVSFRDNAWLSDGCNEISSQQLVYDIRAQRVLGQNSAQPAGDGRVRIVIQPGSQSGKPCTAPGTRP
jgi:lipopolysaccharide transport protein LptA